MNCNIPIRALSVLAVLGMTTASGAIAQSTTNQAGSYQVAQQSYANVIAQLQSGGYRIVEVRKTFLGRIRILARNKIHMREVIVSRSTGEVKRDVVVELMADGSGGDNQSTGSSGSSSSSSSGSTGTGSGSSGSTGSGGGISAGASVGGGGGISAGASVGGGGGINAGVSVGGGGGFNVGVSVGGRGRGRGN